MVTGAEQQPGAGAGRGPDAGGSGSLEGGFVGRPHGLDGSFHVNLARPRLLRIGLEVTVAGRRLEIVRLAGTEQRPIVRLAGVEDRAGAEALRGQALLTDPHDAPALKEGEYWAQDLEGCEVRDGDLVLGTVRRLLELPSCEVLEVAGPSGPDVLVPMVRDAIREVDVAGRRVEVDAAFLGLAGGAEGEGGG